MRLFIPGGGVRQIEHIGQRYRRDGAGRRLDQSHIKQYLRESNFVHYQDFRTESGHVFGVGVEISSLAQIPEISSVLGLPDLGYVEGRVTGLRNDRCDVWLNVAGVECEVEGSEAVLYRLLRNYFRENFVTELQQAIHEFAISLNRPIKIRKTGRPESPHEPDGNLFTIWGWAAARESSQLNPPHSIFGRPIRFSGEGAFAASGEGIPLMDLDTGWCVAEVFTDHLFIHHNFFSDREDDVQIVREVMARASVLLGANPEEIAARRVAAEQAAAARIRASYVALANQRFVRTLNLRQAELTELPARIETTRLELQRLIRQEQSLARLVSSMKDGVQSAQYESEFDRILSLPKVTKLNVDGEKIKVHTTRLFCQNPKTGIIHRLARMEITIDTKAQSTECVLRWRSLEGNIAREVTKPAPHVIGGNGEACLGNARGQIEQLFAQQEWEQLIHLAIHFVESVNIEDSAGATLVYWPHATPAELIGTEWEGQQVTVAA